MFEVYESLADAVADAIDEYGWWLDGPLAYPLPLDQDEEWARHCSDYRMLRWADQSPEHYDEAQWAAMDEEHRVALRKKIMDDYSREFERPIPEAKPPMAPPSATVVVPVSNDGPKGTCCGGPFPKKDDQ